MPTHLIDEHGERLFPSESLSRKYGTWLGPEELTDYLVRNLGHVAVRVMRGGAEFWFRPDIVKPKALSRGIHLLYDAGASRNRVVWHARDWQSETFPARTRAIQHIADLVGAEQLKKRRDDFLSRDRKREHLAATSPLRQLIEAWSAGMTSVEELRAHHRDAATRFVIVSAPGPRAEPVIVSAGGEAKVMGNGWFDRMSNLRIADWPDVDYGRWVAKTYREVGLAARPHLDDVDCTIQWPCSIAQRYTYNRLILPCRTSSGASVLLGAMVSDTDIDLRAQVH